MNLEAFMIQDKKKKEEKYFSLLKGLVMVWDLVQDALWSAD